MFKYPFKTQILRERLSDLSASLIQQDRMVGWVFIRIWQIDVKSTNLYFCTWNSNKSSLDFPLKRPFFCSLSFTVPWLLVENASKIPCDEKKLISTILRKQKIRTKLRFLCRYIWFSIQSSSSYLFLPILTLGVVAYASMLYSDNLSRNNCVPIIVCYTRRRKSDLFYHNYFL